MNTDNNWDRGIFILRPNNYPVWDIWQFTKAQDYPVKVNFKTKGKKRATKHHTKQKTTRRRKLINECKKGKSKR